MLGPHSDRLDFALWQLDYMAVYVVIKWNETIKSLTQELLQIQNIV